MIIVKIKTHCSQNYFYRKKNVTFYLKWTLCKRNGYSQRKRKGTNYFQIPDFLNTIRKCLNGEYGSMVNGEWTNWMAISYIDSIFDIINLSEN